jgi:soluble lytic murein transglycosylase-like protein
VFKGLKANAIDPRRPVGLLLAVLGLAVVLPLRTVSADVFKYVDQEGNVFFSDAPLSGSGLRLEWKRTAARLAASNRARSREAQQQAEVIEQRGALAPLSASMWLRRVRYQPLIDAAAHRHGLVPALLHAVIRAESAYEPEALSHAGACGLMQLMPGTAARFGVTEIWDPAQNIEGGAAYLRVLLDLFDGDIRLALAGYNAGENAVKRHGYQIPPYAETQHYVRQVLRFLRAEQASDSS